ncbi:MAG: hypothetical protein GX331_05245, partial [Firmicutes bacterium]|nr:hypothetical protein [Bacillota bacterium]
IAAALFSFLSDPVYEATTTLMVRDQGSAAQMMLFDSMGGTVRNAAQNYVQIMKSRTILEPVLTKLGWDDISLTAVDKQLVIQPIQGTDILRLSMQSTDPEKAQQFVNTLSDVFIAWNRHSRQEDQRSARLFIEAQLESVSADLRKAEERLREYRENERALSPSNETIARINQLTSLEADLAEVRVALVETQERITQVRTQLADQDETLLSTTTIAENPFVAQYRSRLADLEISLSGARERYTDKHPSVLALQAEIEDVRQKLSEQVQRVISTETRTINPIHRELYGSLINLEVELMALQSREQALRSLVADSEAELTSLPAKELELARLMREAQVLEELYIMLMKRNEETRIAEAMQTADVQVIDRAVLPERPVKPRIKLNIAIAGVLGLFIGVGLAFLLDFMDTSIKTKDEVEEILGLPVLGQIPDFDLTAPENEKRFLGF